MLPEELEEFVDEDVFVDTSSAVLLLRLFSSLRILTGVSQS